MKQLLVCKKAKEDGVRLLRVKTNILTNAIVPVEDIISPQKTTLEIPKNNKIDVGDIVILRDNSTSDIEYIGYVDTVVTKERTEVSCYPLINVFDNDFVLDQMYKEPIEGSGANEPVDLAEWLTQQLTRAFINTEDDLQALPLEIRNKTVAPCLYKAAIDTSNLLEVYNDAFINAGIYVKFTDLMFTHGELSGIYCDIHSHLGEEPYILRFDNPAIHSVKITDDTFNNYNKLILTEKLPEGESRDPIRYYFYLLNNNDITRDANDPRRISPVRSKEESFSLDEDDSTEQDLRTKLQEEGKNQEEIEDAINQSRANSLILAAYKSLQSPEYNLKIEIEMIKNKSLSLYKRVEFLAESGVTYYSNITKIEKLNDLQVRITLGALRNSLTDFKKRLEGI